MWAAVLNAGGQSAGCGVEFGWPQQGLRCWIRVASLWGSTWMLVLGSGHRAARQPEKTQPQLDPTGQIENTISVFSVVLKFLGFHKNQWLVLWHMCLNGSGIYIRFRFHFFPVLCDVQNFPTCANHSSLPTLHPHRNHTNPICFACASPPPLNPTRPHCSDNPCSHMPRHLLSPFPHVARPPAPKSSHLRHIVTPHPWPIQLCLFDCAGVLRGSQSRGIVAHGVRLWVARWFEHINAWCKGLWVQHVETKCV